jgi:hypothetical protein
MMIVMEAAVSRQPSAISRQETLCLVFILGKRPSTEKPDFLLKVGQLWRRQSEEAQAGFGCASGMERIRFP